MGQAYPIPNESPRKEDRKKIRVSGSEAYGLIERILMDNKIGIRHRSLKMLIFVAESKHLTDEIEVDIVDAGGTISDEVQFDMDTGNEDGE